MEVARSTDAFRNIYQTTRRHIPEGRMFIVTAVRKSKVRGKCNLLFKKILLSRSAVHAVSWLQMAATFMAATSDAGKRSFLKR